MPYGFSPRRALLALAAHRLGLLPLLPLGEAVLLGPLPAIINRLFWGKFRGFWANPGGLGQIQGGLG